MKRIEYITNGQEITNGITVARVVSADNEGVVYVDLFKKNADGSLKPIDCMVAMAPEEIADMMYEYDGITREQVVYHAHMFAYEGVDVDLDSKEFEIAYDCIVDCMDDEIREAVHIAVAPCTNEKFLLEYIARDPEFKSVLNELDIAITNTGIEELKRIKNL